MTLYGPSLIDSLPILQSIPEDFKNITGSNKLKEESILIQGKYDYMYEWHENPPLKELMNFIKLLDDKLNKVGVKFTINTLESHEDEPAEIQSENFVTYIKIIGPGIYYTIENFKSISVEKITRHGMIEGHSDYFFEWVEKPTEEDIQFLIKSIESYLPKNFQVFYKISTKDSSLALRRLQLAQMMIYSHIPYV
ncbi:MAG: hypothetical protein ACW981_11475 [Candidatus Hodarchaeales archaeon]